MIRKMAAPLALTAVFMIGCASAGQESAGSPEQSDNVLRVENHNWLDATVYAVKAGSRHRLGTVATSGSERFRIPEHLISPQGELRVVVDLIGSKDRYVTPPIAMNPGAVVELDVENHLALSSYMVRRGR